MSTRIAINENNIVEIFVGDEVNPTIRQPQHPEGRDWVDRAEAEEWATLTAANYGVPNA